LKPLFQASEIETELDKSPDAFRTISEVADDLDVPQHVLRFWETRFPQIRPLKRGGGRRYYRPDDVLLLQGIRRLLYGEGYTIKGVLRILKEQGVRQVQAIGRGAPLTSLPDAGEDGAPSRAEPFMPGESPGKQAGRQAQSHDYTVPDDGGDSGGVLDDGTLSALKTVYFELGECRRVLDDALAATQSGEELA
jgi:DNA-binding transcriptional MerR regulator